MASSFGILGEQDPLPSRGELIHTTLPVLQGVFQVKHHNRIFQLILAHSEYSLLQEPAIHALLGLATLITTIQCDASMFIGVSVTIHAPYLLGQLFTIALDFARPADYFMIAVALTHVQPDKSYHPQIDGLPPLNMLLSFLLWSMHKTLLQTRTSSRAPPPKIPNKLNSTTLSSSLPLFDSCHK